MDFPKNASQIHHKLWLLGAIFYAASSWCYKTFFGGNLDFPKIKKLNKVGSDDWTYTEMLKQCYLKLNYIRTLLSCFSLGENLDFLQKKFYNINYWARTYIQNFCTKSRYTSLERSDWLLKKYSTNPSA